MPDMIGILRSVTVSGGRAALKLAQYAYVLETGRVVLEGPAHELAEDPQVRRAYLGEG